MLIKIYRYILITSADEKLRKIFETLFDRYDEWDFLRLEARLTEQKKKTNYNKVFC